MEKLFFSISGEFVTKAARDFVVEDRWEHALELLHDNIQGSSYDIAVSILKGEKCFAGVNEEMDLYEEDQTKPEVQDYIKHLKYKYTGICKFDNKYWRPYAYVNGYCELDLNSKYMDANKYHNYSNMSIPTKMCRDYTKWSMARNNFYMQNPSNDYAVYLELKDRSAIVLWEEIRMPPLWIKHYNCWQEALNDYLQAENRLSCNGPQDYKELLNEKIAERKDNSENMRKAGKRYAEQQDKAFQDAYKQTAAYVNDLPNRHTLDTDNGWLSPQGKILPFEYSEHEQHAYVILKEQYHRDPDEEGSNFAQAGDILIKLGWRKLQKGKWPTLYLSDYTVTQSQFDTIYDYCKFNKKAMPPKLEVK